MSQPIEEKAFLFRCEGEDLLGIVALPAEPASAGVLIVVGGPQYRVGSHRQFVHLARHLAVGRAACMRFDYRGMGDGGGAMRSFEQVDADLRAAVDAFQRACPRAAGVVLWGLCDGASAICFYAATDPRVTGVVLVNPWVRTQVGEARTYLRHYYVRRLFSRAFWRKLATGGVDVRKTVGSLLSAARLAFGGTSPEPTDRAQSAGDAGLPLPERMAQGLLSFPGRILVILSGNDYTAKEFLRVRRESPSWARALDSAEIAQLAEADHTFSTEAWKTWIAETTLRWLPRGGQPSRCQRL
jgi:uncharacterized protein